jgi:uncharacterized membrane protein YcaP (DUF421 family)
MFYDSLGEVWRIVVVGTLAYVGLVLLLRVSGKRTLSKLNAFDLVVTVSLGSMLATVILSKDVALLEGLVGFGLVIGLQLVVTWLSVRSRWVSRVVKSEPVMLCYRGQMLEAAMRRERVTASEVLEAVRRQGMRSVADAEAVVLETGAILTVIGRGPVEGAGAGERAPVLRDVKRRDETGEGVGETGGGG